jgi:alpha-tubulin suppressor-like RCC1 family protein
LIGSHSIAIDSNGSIYGWGVGVAIGLGSLDNVNSPIRILHDFNGDEFVNITNVSCGGGFSVCVNSSGQVYSWGIWAHGRLGDQFLFDIQVILT